VPLRGVHDGEIVGMKTNACLPWLLIVALLGAATGPACGNSGPSAPSNPGAPPTLLYIEGGWSHLVPGDRVPFFVDAQFADGRIVQGLQGVAWSSSDTRIGSMSDHVFVANGPGDVNVRASYRGVAATSHLTVVAAADLREVRLTDSPSELTAPVPPFELAPGFVRHVYAVVVFPDGSRHEEFSGSDLVAWTSSDPNVAVVSYGGITAVAPGVATIGAEYHGHTADVVVTVKPTHPGQDSLESLGGSITGGLRPGENTTVSETLTYNLVSGPSGLITILVTDQNAAPIGSNPAPAVNVAIGAGAVTVSDTLVIPLSATELCTEIRLVITGATRSPITTGRHCMPLRLSGLTLHGHQLGLARDVRSAARRHPAL
jgi:hypothetical protein